MDYWQPHQIRTCVKDAFVEIVLKKDQGTDRRVRGRVAKILTNSATHRRGIKVMLTNGAVGRVQRIL